MKTRTVLGVVLFATIGAAQSRVDADSHEKTKTAVQNQGKKTKGSAKGDIGGGAANVGSGAAKGAGSLAGGTAKGAVDLATLHPIDAGVSIGSGAASAGKDVTVGTVKGAGKITRGVGKVFKKVL